MDGGGGGGDTEQKALSFGLGVFLHFFSSSRDDGLYHVTRNNTNVCDIFPFFFRNDGPLVKFLGRKNAHDDETTTHKTKQSIGIRDPHFLLRKLHSQCLSRN